MIDYNRCPNCKAHLNDMDEYYEEPELFNGFWRTWHYICPNCGKEYAYTRDYKCVHEEMVEVEKREEK